MNYVVSVSFNDFFLESFSVFADTEEEAFKKAFEGAVYGMALNKQEVVMLRNFFQFQIMYVYGD